MFQPQEVHEAAAVVAYLIPGLRFFHEGQLEGRKVKVSVHLGRRPDEAVDDALQEFYDRLLKCVRRSEVRNGSWQLLECRSVGSDTSWQQFIAFTWQGQDGQRLLIAVNYGPNRGQCRVKLPFFDPQGGRFQLKDLMSTTSYERDSGSLISPGLYLNMPGWAYHVFELSELSKPDDEDESPPPSFRLRYVLHGHEGWINRIAWSSDGKLLASPSNDGTIRLWDAECGECRGTLPKLDNVVVSVAWSPDGRMLAASFQDHTVRVYDTTCWASLQVLEGHTDWVFSVAWSPDGKLLASASGAVDNSIRIWKTVNGELLHLHRKLEGSHPSYNVFSLAWSPDGRMLAAGSEDQTIRLWDAERGVQHQILRGHYGDVLSVAWSPDGHTLASGSADATIRIWDTELGVQQYTLEGHTDQVRTVAFSSDGRLLASKSADNTVRLWSVDPWKMGS